ncbi:MAG: tRNA (N(6)-L-threonylcarbamoyladenosine(37)-C(2))-methylthiotransferase MtaB [Candidatus Saganbacteria bacterium]|nr:tRNA (N(6)-L-threonylcarbamoyladenosine(37)-C(2))-methylthiotransferase MtaB [Candidatus Saganbacteria bacterium]
MTKIAFYTLGCKSNQYETDLMKEKCLSADLKEAPFREKADIYVINTCTVTSVADKKSRHAIRFARKQNPDALIIATGCYAEVSPKDIARISEVDMIIPNKMKKNILDYLKIPMTKSPGRAGQLPNSKSQTKVRANLMIEDGCEHYCSYCIVPYSRGKVKSKPIDNIIKEAEELVASGAKEIVLTGINLGAYGLDARRKTKYDSHFATAKRNTLPNVIKALSEIDGLYRIRLSSLEPMFITKKLIDTIADAPKVCPHLHIPLQSGDNKILKTMKRKYTAKRYTELISCIRKKIKNAAINTDIITGFPGEGEKEFNNTIKLVNKVKFSRIHVFSYSKRTGTPAGGLQAPDPEITHERSVKLIGLRGKHMRAYAKKWLGKTVEVLVEQRDKATRMLDGLTPHYIRVFFEGEDELIGKLVTVKVKKIESEFVIGSLAS